MKIEFEHGFDKDVMFTFNDMSDLYRYLCRVLFIDGTVADGERYYGFDEELKEIRVTKREIL